MIPATVDIINDVLAGHALTGALTLPNDAIAFLFDGGHILRFDRTFGRVWLLDAEESARVIVEVERANVRAEATLRTLDALKRTNDPGARLSARREATVRERDRSATRTPVRIIDEFASLDVPDFMRGAVLADEGVSPRSDVERKARTEQIAREIPEV